MGVLSFRSPNMPEQLLQRVKEIDIEGIQITRRNSLKKSFAAGSSDWLSRLSNATSMLYTRKLAVLCVLAACIVVILLIHMLVQVGKMQVAVFAQSTVCEDCVRGASFAPFPKILHHTWKNASVPPKWQNSTAACRTLNPHYKYMFWTDRDIERLIHTEYPWFWETYVNYEYNIQRADAGRYFILYHYGGVYTDLDIHCKYPFDQILENVTQYDIVLPQGPPIGVTAEVMFAKPRHRFMELVIHSLAEADQWRMFPYATIIFSTGPMFMSNCLMKYEHKEQFYIIPYEIYTEKLFLNLHGGSWHEWDGDFIFWVYTHKGPLSLCFLILLALAIVYARYGRKPAFCKKASGYHGHYTKVQLS